MHIVCMNKDTQLAAKNSHDTIGKKVDDAIAC
jgi:hypothetical protein